MQIRIVAVGQRITEWAQSAVSDYLSRFPRDFRVELREIRTEPRAGQTPARLMAAEAENAPLPYAYAAFTNFSAENIHDAYVVDAQIRRSSSRSHCPEISVHVTLFSDSVYSSYEFPCPRAAPAEEKAPSVPPRTGTRTGIPRPSTSIRPQPVWSRRECG